MRKRGQIDLSFGMIFSIILIIVFIAFAFYAIMKVIEMQKNVQVKNFVNDFQDDINKVWQSAQASEKKTYSVPKEIEQVCIDEFAMLYFEPLGSGQGTTKELNHLDIAQITSEGIFCVDVVDGKFEIYMKKDFGDKLVKLENE